MSRQPTDFDYAVSLLTLLLTTLGLGAGVLVLGASTYQTTADSVITWSCGLGFFAGLAALVGGLGFGRRLRRRFDGRYALPAAGVVVAAACALAAPVLLPLSGQGVKAMAIVADIALVFGITVLGAVLLAGTLVIGDVPEAD